MFAISPLLLTASSLCIFFSSWNGLQKLYKEEDFTALNPREDFAQACLEGLLQLQGNLPCFVCRQAENEPWTVMSFSDLVNKTVELLDKMANDSESGPPPQQHVASPAAAANHQQVSSAPESGPPLQQHGAPAAAANHRPVVNASESGLPPQQQQQRQHGAPLAAAYQQQVASASESGPPKMSSKKNLGQKRKASAAQKEKGGQQVRCGGN